MYNYVLGEHKPGRIKPGRIKKGRFIPPKPKLLYFVIRPRLYASESQPVLTVVAAIFGAFGTAGVLLGAPLSSASMFAAATSSFRPFASSS